MQAISSLQNSTELSAWPRQQLGDISEECRVTYFNISAVCLPLLQCMPHLDCNVFHPPQDRAAHVQSVRVDCAVRQYVPEHQRVTGTWAVRICSAPGGGIAEAAAGQASVPRMLICGGAKRGGSVCVWHIREGVAARSSGLDRPSTQHRMNS